MKRAITNIAHVAHHLPNALRALLTDAPDTAVRAVLQVPPPSACSQLNLDMGIWKGVIRNYFGCSLVTARTGR